jgi:hypothetical protein
MEWYGIPVHIQSCRSIAHSNLYAKCLVPYQWCIISTESNYIMTNLLTKQFQILYIVLAVSEGGFLRQINHDVFKKM